MKCKRFKLYLPGSAMINLGEYSERGVRSAVDLLPEYYRGGDKDIESMGL